MRGTYLVEKRADRGKKAGPNPHEKSRRRSKLRPVTTKPVIIPGYKIDSIHGTLIP